MKLGTIALIAAAAAVAGACGSEGGHGITSPGGSSVSFDEGQQKVSVCQATGNGSFHLISIAAPAVPAHLAQGGGLPGSALPDHSGLFSADCHLDVISLDATTSYATGYGGGGGGGPFTDGCPAGSVAVGMNGDAGDWFGWGAIWDYQLNCRQLLGDGTLGSASTTLQHGNDFGSIQGPFSGTCSGSQVLVGANGGVNVVVQSIVGSCAGVNTILASGGPESNIGPWTGVGVGAFGPWSLACNPGFAITGLAARSGNVLDAAGYTCTKIVEHES